ncbi:MAG: hypothetical protein D6785_15475, partial [Planctomycetota bacterium]
LLYFLLIFLGIVILILLFTDWEEVSYKDAVKANKAHLYRRYLRDYPKGKYVQKAKDGLKEVYKEAFKKYSRLAAKGKTPAQKGLLALLQYFVDHPFIELPKVTVYFYPAKNLDEGNIRSLLEKETGSKKIASLAPFFTSQKNKKREEQIIETMQYAFWNIFKDKLFELVPGTLANKGPRILILYNVLLSRNYFTLRSQKNLPLSQRDIFPGVAFQFFLSIQVPGSKFPPSKDPKKGYLTYFFIPAPKNFKVRRDAGNLAKQVYGSMVKGAFQKFEEELVKAFGAPKKSTKSKEKSKK